MKPLIIILALLFYGCAVASPETDRLMTRTQEINNYQYEHAQTTEEQTRQLERLNQQLNQQRNW